MATSRLNRQRRLSGIAGAAVLITFLAMLGLAVTAGNGLPGRAHRTLKVAFTDVGALRKGDDVRVAGIRVGKVDKIALVDGRPTVTLSLDGKRKIYRDGAAASIAQRSALGQAYINLTPGNATSGELADGQTITENSANSAQDLTNVLNVLDSKTRGSLRTVVSELGNGAQNHGADVNAALGALPQALPNLANVSKALTVDNGQRLSNLLTQTNSLAQSFAGQQKDLAELAKQLQVTLTAVSVDDGAPLATTLTKAPDTLTSVRDGLGALTQPLRMTTQAVSDLRAGAQSLGAATPALRAVLREGIAPLNKVPNVMGKAQGPVRDLTALLTDARPIAPRVAQAIETVSTPLAVLAPYSPEISRLFTYLSDALHEGDAAGHWLRFYPVVHLETVDGILPIPDPFVHKDAYPAPGVAQFERSTTLLGTRK